MILQTFIMPVSKPFSMVVCPDFSMSCITIGLVRDYHPVPDVLYSVLHIDLIFIVYILNGVPFERLSLSESVEQRTVLAQKNSYD